MSERNEFQIREMTLGSSANQGEQVKFTFRTSADDEMNFVLPAEQLWKMILGFMRVGGLAHDERIKTGRAEAGIIGATPFRVARLAFSHSTDPDGPALIIHAETVENVPIHLSIPPSLANDLIAKIKEGLTLLHAWPPKEPA